MAKGNDVKRFPSRRVDEQSACSSNLAFMSLISEYSRAECISLRALHLSLYPRAAGTWKLWIFTEGQEVGDEEPRYTFSCPSSGTSLSSHSVEVKSHAELYFHASCSHVVDSPADVACYLPFGQSSLGPASHHLRVPSSSLNWQKHVRET